MSAVAERKDWASWMPIDPIAAWWADVQSIAAKAQARRVLAGYNTGSVSELDAYMLRALAEALSARVVIEVGTFIGTSTLAMASAATVQHIYTCDFSNDCLAATDVIHTYPKQTSTEMLRDLRRRGVKADLCFFDGALHPQDVDLLSQVTHQKTAYAFHDYNYGPKVRKHGRLEMMPRKGIGNVQLIQSRVTQYRLIEPCQGTTLAMLVPEAL